MKHFKSLYEVTPGSASAVAIGVFDGVHLGHQKLLEAVVTQARDQHIMSVVVTFFPYPNQVIQGFRPGHYLTMPELKAELLGQLGIDCIVTLEFNDEMRVKRAEEFVADLKLHLNMAALCVGPDFALGYKREGTTSFLADIAPKYSFELQTVPPVTAGSERISSSKIRQAILDGNVELAEQLLGRNFRLAGLVIHGDGRGKTIGIPTANLLIPQEQAVPARGVYSAWGFVDDIRIPAAVNVGIRPTVSGDQVLRVEAHLIDFDADLYGKQISLEFVSRIRDEMKFGGVDELVAQIRTDIEAARLVLASKAEG